MVFLFTGKSAGNWKPGRRIHGFSVAAIVRNITAIDARFAFEDGATLILFDEIQEFPEIATALKFFAEDGRFDVICSGSVLGVHYKRVASFSVGYQESLTMRSLDFEEFLFAQGYGDGQIEEAYRFIADGKPVPEAINATFRRLFIEYCACGGMPEAVCAYVEDGTFRNPSLEPLGSVEFTAGDGRFSSGGAATATFPKGANSFFNAKIVE